MNVVTVCLFAAVIFGVGRPVTPNGCIRTPADVRSPKRNGDNGFSINISGNPRKYVPEAAYRVSLRGMKMQYSVQKFVGFMIVAEAEQDGRHAGAFQLLGDSVAKFSELCPHSVVHTSLVPKSEVEVTWKAPRPGSGCVKLKATVLEYREAWYMDDGNLTREICEEASDEIPTGNPVSACCACGDAKYEMTFQGLWNRHTHPKDFPQDLWTTHFSDIIGASHNANYTMWAPGHEASLALQKVAEYGSNGLLEAEMKEQADNIRTIIKARGLWYPKLNSSAFAVFNVDHRHHLVSLVTMLGPSPDWIVGVSSLDLCLKNCSWVSQIVQDLYPWDAGTDSGITYTTPDEPTNPKERIRQISSSYPNTPDSPFYDASGEAMKPVARLTINMQRRYEKSCTDERVQTETPEEPEEDTDIRPECMMTDWSEFSQCSATCGKGTRMATREYKNPMKARMVQCSAQLQKKMPCHDTSGPCPPTSRCGVGPWSEWGECSTDCGKGTRTRRRSFLDPKSRKTCGHMSMSEKEDCMGHLTECVTTSPECSVTQWSEWSPCTATCGKGTTVRTRLHLFAQSQPHCNVELMQKEPCMAANCDEPEASKVCLMDKEVGPCRGHFPRWYYDKTKLSCQGFSYGGCRGNRNNFETYDECKHLCNAITVPIDSTNSDSHVVNCMAVWTEYSPCSKTCGRGHMTRHRMIKVHPKNGGKMCPKKMSQTKKCILRPCAGRDGRI